MCGYAPDGRLSMRPATIEDVEDIASVAQAGFPDDPEFDYRFPRRHLFPLDNRAGTLLEYAGYLRQPDKYAVMVVTASDNMGKPVALSVWDVCPTAPPQEIDLINILSSPETAQSPSPVDGFNSARLFARQDVDVAHFDEFARSMEAGFEDFFARHGSRQLHLWLLCTHPSFRRRGAASMLCRWGLARAASDGVRTTVLASPMGRRLYERLGFELNGSFIVKVGGEQESLMIWALTYAL